MKLTIRDVVARTKYLKLRNPGEAISAAIGFIEAVAAENPTHADHAVHIIKHLELAQKSIEARAGDAVEVKWLIVNLTKQADELHETVEALLTLAVDARNLLRRAVISRTEDSAAWVACRDEWLKQADKLEVNEATLFGGEFGATDLEGGPDA